MVLKCLLFWSFQVAENAVLFMAYGMCQKVVMTMRGKQSVSRLNPVENAFSGSLAAFFSSLVLCPTELVKCKLQVSQTRRSKWTANEGHSHY